MTLSADDLLDLPSASTDSGVQPQLTMNEVIALCEKMLPFWNQQRYSKELPPLTGVEFVLS